jgi:hypothetical protein
VVLGLAKQICGQADRIWDDDATSQVLHGHYARSKLASIMRNAEILWRAPESS